VVSRARQTTKQRIQRAVNPHTSKHRTEDGRVDPKLPDPVRRLSGSGYAALGDNVRRPEWKNIEGIPGLLKCHFSVILEGKPSLSRSHCRLIPYPKQLKIRSFCPSSLRPAGQFTVYKKSRRDERVPTPRWRACRR
jgi:hypothetical protein